MYNCTTPFGPDKSQICTDGTVGKAAFEFLEGFIRENKTSCLEPCKTIHPRISLVGKTSWQYYPRVTLYLPLTVKVSTLSETKEVTRDTTFMATLGATVGFCALCLFCLDKIIDVIFDCVESNRCFQTAWNLLANWPYLINCFLVWWPICHLCSGIRKIRSYVSLFALLATSTRVRSQKIHLFKFDWLVRRTHLLMR